MTKEERYQQYMEAGKILARLAKDSRFNSVEINLSDAQAKLATAFGLELIKGEAVKP